MRTPTKKRPPMEMEPGEGKAHEMKESPEEEVREGTESEEGEDYGKKSRKRSAKGSKNTKAPMDCEGCAGKKAGKCKKCMAKAMADGSCGGPMKKRSDALTAPEYLAACELGIQNRSRTYIRARLDATERLDLKCGKGAISQGEKCHKGPAQKANPNIVAAKQISARTNKSGNVIEFSKFNKNTGNLEKPKKQKEGGVNWNTVGQAGLVAGGIAALAVAAGRRPRGRIIVTGEGSSAAATRGKAMREQANKIFENAERNIKTIKKSLSKRERVRNSTSSTLEQIGAKAENKEEFNKFMSKPDAPLFAKSKGRKPKSTVRVPKGRSTKRARGVYADGFELDFAALAL